MGDPTEDFFARVAGMAGLPTRVRSVRGSIQVDLLRDGQVDHWFLQVHDGRVSIKREKRKADCLLTLAKEKFDDLVTGQDSLNLMLPKGEVALEGNLQMVTVLRVMLPGPPGAIDPRELARRRRQ